MELLKHVNVNKKLNKHIHVKLKSIKRLINKIVFLNFVKSEKNITDPLAKCLSRSVVLDTSREMGISQKRNSTTVKTQPS